MIVPMRKIHLVARQRDRERLLKELRELGVVHLTPSDPSRAVADERTTRRVQTLEHALHLLSGVAARKPAPEIAPLEAAEEVLEIERRSAEGHSRLASLHHQLEKTDSWGDLRLDHLRELREAGIDVQFYGMPRHIVSTIDAECAEVVGYLPGRQVLVAVVDRSGNARLPAQAVRILLPPADAFSLRAEAAQIEALLHKDLERLHELAGLVPQMKKELAGLHEQADLTIALRGGTADESLFALQGWLPADAAQPIGEQLASQRISAAVQALEPAPDEQPPTLIELPRWAQPVDSLLRMLGTVPGYREIDVSIPFLIALPIFTAFLISDGGYGALLLLGPLLLYQRLSNRIGQRFTQLLMIVGSVSLVWGVITSSFFGVSLYPPLISVDLSESSRELMMWLSFTLGAIHLSIAQLWQCLRSWPDARAVGNIGWALFIWGMYGVVKMFVLDAPMHWQTPWSYLLLTGAVLAIVFASSNPHLGKRLALGVARFPLSMLSAFSDVISYVRLMAVGLASTVLAVSFNEMAANAGSWPLAACILLLGHSLNMGLALIAMFAHGVRLNMLEFASNLGMQWTGFPYQPFAPRTYQEATT